MFRFFPSLPALDMLGRRGLVVGFPALTLALVIGWAWTVSFQPEFGMSEPQVIWGLLTWLIFAVVVLLRLTKRADTQRRAALASVIGFLIVVVVFVLLRVFVTGERVFL